MQKLIWQNAEGEEINLTSGNYGITEWEGFSNADLNIQSQQVPFQDGGVFLDALLDQRELSVTLAMNDEGNLETRYRLRRELIHALNPKLGEGYLIYTNDFISKRIKCVAQVPLFETHNSNDSGTPKASLAWTACNPYWEDLDENTILFNITEQPEIENTGDLPAQIEMDWITNEVVNPKVTNIATNRYIEYKGKLSENLNINTNFGKKGAVTNKINYTISGLLGNNINELIYVKEKDLFVAVGYGGLILISNDLYKWESMDNIIPSAYDVPDLKTICYSKEKDLFIAGGSSGTFSSSFVLISSNGINWEKGNTISPIATTFNKIIYVESQHLFYGFTQSGTYTTQDGKEWTKIDNNAFIDVIYSEFLQLYVGVTNTSILTSQDCNTWVTRASNLSQLIRIYSLEEKQKILIGANNIIYSSSDGITWANEAVTGLITGFTYSQNTDKTYAISNSLNGVIYVSTDGTNWNEQDINIEESLTINNIYFSKEKGMFIAIGDVIIESTDSVIWNYIFVTNQHTLNDIIYVRKKFLFVAVGYESLLSSTDGYNWNNYINEQNENINSICYSLEKDLFVAVGNGVIYTSNDGVNWDRTEKTGDILNKVIFIEKWEKFIIVGDNDVIYTSEDGETWTEQESGLSNYNISSITYNSKQNKLICLAKENITGGDQVIIGSGNGILWDTLADLEQKSTVEYKELYYAEKYQRYYISGLIPSTMFSTPVIKSSLDLMTWSELTIPSSLSMVGIGDCFYYSSNFDKLLIGGGGVLLSCADGETLLYEGYVGVREIIYSIKDFSNDIILCAGTYILNSTTENTKNRIDKISENSDMNLNLIVGDNKLRINYDSGNMDVILKYRQKYIGV